MVLNVSFAVVLAACFPRATWKYGERSYRNVLLEAGHIGQNLCLLATALRLGARHITGFVDDALNAMLKLDGVNEASVYMVVVGIQGGTANPDQQQKG